MGELDYQDWGEDLDVDNWDYDLALPVGDADRNMDGYAGTPASASNSGGEKDGEKRKNPPEDEDGSPSADPHDTEPKRRGGLFPFPTPSPPITLCKLAFHKYI